MRIKIYLLCFVFLSGTSASAQKTYLESACDTSEIKFRAVSEVGFISVIAHQIQLGENGTYFNYVKDGGQDVLFAFTSAPKTDL